MVVTEKNDKDRFKLLQQWGHGYTEWLNSSNEYSVGNDDADIIAKDLASGTHRVYWHQSDTTLASALRKQFDDNIAYNFSSYGCYFTSLLCGTIASLYDIFEVPRIGFTSDKYDKCFPSEFGIWMNDEAFCKLVGDCIENSYMNNSFYIFNRLSIVDSIIARLYYDKRIPIRKFEINDAWFQTKEEVLTNSKEEYDAFFTIYCLDTIWRNGNVASSGYHFVLGDDNLSRVAWDPEGTRLSRGILGLTNRNVDRRFRVIGIKKT